MTFDEFARILTASGEDIYISWKTIKYLLLFRIYEKLHGRLMKENGQKGGGEEMKEDEGKIEENEYGVYGGDEE